MRYHPGQAEALTERCYPPPGPCQMGSLAGAAASQKVTEAYKGHLRLVGNQPLSAKAKGGLTVRQTCRAEAKAGPSDPLVLRGRASDQRIKATPGITG